MFLWATLATLAGCGDPRSGDIERLLERYDAASARLDWPGFEPQRVPLALWSDTRTYLLRHPAPPETFERLRGFGDAFRADTVPPDLRANTDVLIAGVRSAAVGVTEQEWDIEALVPLAVHEAFHAWQSEARPSWTANEVDLFTYPVRSRSLLELRRRETAALRRAVAAPDSLREVCWTQAFLRERVRRFGRLPPEAAAYERGQELREGLADYIEGRVTGAAPALPGEGFPPEDVRERAYAVGHAQAVLLDRLSPGWKRTLVDETAGQGTADDEADPAPALHELLARAVARLGDGRCGPSPDEAGRVRAVVRQDLADLAARDRRARAGFLEAAGWRLEVVAGETPLWPERFDPLNVRVLAETEVLHERWLRLGNEAVRFETLDRTALTRGVGPHPLFDGVASVLVTGLPEPAVTTRGDTLRIEAAGLTLVAVGGELERDGRALLVRAGPKR